MNLRAKFPVEEYHADMRLDMFLSHTLSEVSRSYIQKVVISGKVKVNEKVAKKNTILRFNDVVTVDDPEVLVPQSPEIEVVPQEMELNIIYEDQWFLVLNKPAGIIVHPGNGNPDGTILNGALHYLKDDPGSPRLVHRLDKDTSGVLMVAKSAESHEAMSRLFAHREVYKGYLGFMVGRYPDLEGRVDAPLGRSKVDPIKRTVRPDGRDARTDYALLKYKSGIGAMAYRLHTGRTHQIRVHSAYSGFPIVMDHQYRGEKFQVKLLEPMERSFAYKFFTRFHRQALHSRYLAFDHPFTGERMTLVAPLFEDFKNGYELMDVTEEDLNIFETERLDSIGMA